MDIFKNCNSVLFEKHDKSSPFNSTHYFVSYPQNGDFIVTIESVTSLHSMYSTRVGSSSLIAYCLLLPKFWSRPGGFANAQNKTFLFCARELTYDLNLRTRLRQDQGRLA